MIGRIFPHSGVKEGDSPQEIADKVARQRQGVDMLLDRFEDLGFNSMRFWNGFPEGDAFTPGDGSLMDSANYFIARAGQRGFRIWNAGLNQVGNATPDDVNILEDPETAEAWKAAVAEGRDGRMSIRNNLARIWDPRLQALGIARMSTVAGHYNPYTGLRWADDPTFGVWELSNEEWWITKMVNGNWQNLPAFFRNQLIGLWNDFLREKYGDDEALAAAWEKLLPGETLGRILFLPMSGATGVQAAINDEGSVAVEAMAVLAQEYRRSDFSRQRGADVMEFLTRLILRHKQKEDRALRPLGRSLRMSPLLYDTGIGYRIQEQYLHQHADAIAHDAYINGIGRNRWDRVEAAEDELDRQRAVMEAMQEEPNDGKWNNWLLKPPGIAQGVPWLEHNRAPGMPYLVYETQIRQAAKYRADFPLRLAALGAIQDWDWICWHYFGDGGQDRITLEERPFDKPMDITTTRAAQGYHYTYDEVQSSMMRAAAHMFRNGLLEPAPHPTVFLFGARDLYDPDTMPYGRSYGLPGMAFMGTTYEHGMRLWIDPNLRESAVIGPTVSFEQRQNTHNPYHPTGSITFDWKKGHLLLDNPRVSAFAGLIGRMGGKMRFQSGLEIRDVSIRHDENFADPMDLDDRYISFALYPLDGKPLAESRHLSMSLVSGSFNDGFQLPDEGPAVRGELPVRHARVAATLEGELLNGLRWTARDWHMKPIAEGVVENGTFTFDPGRQVFFYELRRVGEE